MKAWTITFGNKSWTDRQVSTAHAVAVADLVGDNWDAVSPWTGPRVLAAWLAVLITSDTGDLDASVKAVYALPIDELVGCLAGREPSVTVSPPPPPEAPPSAPVAAVTPTPSPAPPELAYATTA